MTENKSKYVSVRQLSVRTIKELEEEVAYFKENIPLLLKEIERLKCQVQQFEAIGTIEEFKALKEKSVAKKPLPKGTHKGIDNFYCPNCNHPLTNRHEQCELPYCEICGQKLDWQ